MKTNSIGKIAASAALTGALILSGAGLAFAQTTGTTGSTGVTGNGTTGSTVTSPSSTSGMTGSTGNAVSGSTGTTDTSGTTGTTPGVPNTGAGGDAAANYAILGIAALVAIGGAVYLSRKQFA